MTQFPQPACSPRGDEFQVREATRRRYARAADLVLHGHHDQRDPEGRPAEREQNTLGKVVFLEVGEAFGAARYSADELVELPLPAIAASLGCGSPTSRAALRVGDRVVDLGCGAGIDCLLAARQVGPSGSVVGLDMTPEMLFLACRNARSAGARNVRFVEGHIERLPLRAGSVDVAISNCAVNLVVDRAAVLREVYRVLRPGGRVSFVEVLLEDRLSVADRVQRSHDAAFITTLPSVEECTRLLESAGFLDGQVRLTYDIADGVHAAEISCVKPREVLSSVVGQLDEPKSTGLTRFLGRRLPSAVPGPCHET